MKHHAVVDGIGTHGNRLVDGADAVGIVFHSDNGGLAGGDGISRPRRNSTTARSLTLGDGQRSLAGVLELELALAVVAFVNVAVVILKGFESDFSHLYFLILLVVFGDFCSGFAVFARIRITLRKSSK